MHVPTITSSDNNHGKLICLIHCAILEEEVTEKGFLGSLLFLNVMQYSLIFGYRCLGTAYWSHL